MYDWLQSIHLTAAPVAGATAAPGGRLEWLGYIVHADRANLGNSNVADVFNSMINMLGKVVVILVILLSPSLARKYGKKAAMIAGFAFSAVTNFAFYFVAPTNAFGMIAFAAINAAVYAPTIALVWAMFADVADYSEWKNGRRATGIIFATIGFALKAGLSLGSASFLWLMSMYGYAANQPQDRGVDAPGHPRMLQPLYRRALVVCAVLTMIYKINRRMTLQIADELAVRRAKFASA